MAGPTVRTRLIEQGVPRQLARKLRTKIVKKTMEAQAIAWHDEVLPTHYDPQADVRYRYRPRTEKWKERKRKLGIVEQLVWRGNMRDETIHQRSKPSGSAKRVRITVYGPHYMFKRGMHHELERMDQAARDVIAQEGDKALQKNIDEAVEETKTETEVL